MQTTHRSTLAQDRANAYQGGAAHARLVRTARQARQTAIPSTADTTSKTTRSSRRLSLGALLRSAGRTRISPA
jgi:hypothetical protein